MCDCAMCELTNGRACDRDADDTVRDAEARVYDAAVAACPDAALAVVAYVVLDVVADACDPRVAVADCPRCQADAADDERLYAETALYYARMGDGVGDDAAPADDAPDACYCGAPLHGYAGPCGDCRARQA